MSVLLLGNFVPGTVQAATTQYIYDDLGRLILVEYADGSAIGYDRPSNDELYQAATDFRIKL